MKTSERIAEALSMVNSLEKTVKDIIREIEDYDLERLMKKIDAECMDLHHNLALAKRLAVGIKEKEE